MRLNLPRNNIVRVAPYEKLSAIYDYVMRHVDYVLWAGYVHDLIQAWHPRARDVVDVGCGTGNLLQALGHYGFSLSGCDLSQAMLQRAQEKKGLTTVPLWCSDLDNFAIRRKADVILCLYDSINYVLAENDVIGFVKKAAESLNPQGLLIFDICTERNSIKHFLNYHDHAHHDQFSYDRWSHYDSGKKIQHTEFKIRFKDDPKVYVETHKQKIYGVKQLQDLLRATPFEVMEVYDEFTFSPATKKSNRLHFLMQLGTD